MLYVDSRPVNPFAKSAPSNKRCHEYGLYDDDARAVADKVRERFGAGTTSAQRERIFLLPGRRDMVTRMIGDDLLEVRRRVDEEDGVEVWEEMANGTVPLQRTISAMVAAQVPHFRSAMLTYREPEALADGLSKKAKVFEGQNAIEVIDAGDVKIYVTTHTYNEDAPFVSVVLRADNAATIRKFVDELHMAVPSNTNIGDYLLTG